MSDFLLLNTGNKLLLVDNTSKIIINWFLGVGRRAARGLLTGVW